MLLDILASFPFCHDLIQVGHIVQNHAVRQAIHRCGESKYQDTDNSKGAKHDHISGEPKLIFDFLTDFVELFFQFSVQQELVLKTFDYILLDSRAGPMMSNLSNQLRYRPG